MVEKAKICPTCKRHFTRKELGMGERAWLSRVYCSRKCMFKDTERRGLNFGRDN